MGDSSIKWNFWVILFFVALAGDIICIQLQEETMRVVFKPLIVVTLLVWFITATRHIPRLEGKWILPALSFSLLGDVLLLFDAGDERYFLAGLGSFLIAHVFYIVFFHRIKVAEQIKSRGLILLPVVIYYISLIAVLSPHLGDKKIPVYVYAIVISFMLMLAAHMLYLKRDQTGRWFFAGALLFVLSDSMLAINKFYHPFGMAGILIMGIYGLAQFFICLGAIQYLRRRQIFGLPT